MNSLRNNFNAGELSPKLDFRGDVDKYQFGCLTLENMVPMIEGGAFRMPGTYFVTEVKDSTKDTRIFRFQFSTTQAYIIEFGDLYARFYKDNAQITSGGLPVEVVTPYLSSDLFELKFTQSADTLYIWHPDYAPRKLTRTSHTDWTLSTITFSPPPTQDFGHSPSTTLTPGATTGTGVSFTAGAAGTFLSGDVGRIISSGAGRAAIVSYSSGTLVTADILDDFSSTDPIASGVWSLLGTPIGEITPSGIKKGSICTLTSTDGSEAFTNLMEAAADWWSVSASGTNEYYLDSGASPYSATKPDKIYIEGEESVEGVLGSLGIIQWGWGDNDTLGYDTIYVRLADGADPDNKAASDVTFVKKSTVTSSTDLFRSGDVGKYVFINGGFVKLTVVSSATVAKGEVLQALTASTATSVWTMEEAKWSASRGYPAVGFFYEQRLMAGGSTYLPQSLDGSVSGDYENYSRDPDSDDGAISYNLVSNQVERINWLAGTDRLMIGTRGGPWRFGATSTDEPLTQVNVSAKKQAGIGTKDIAPVNVTDSLAWVDLSGQKVYRMDYSFETDRYIGTNMTRLSEHITRGETLAGSGIVDMAFQQAPVPILWAVRADGVFLGMTYETQEQVYAWFRVVTDGFFESVAVISNGDEEDQVWAVVRRVINGATVRYIEYFKPMEIYGDISESFFMHSGVTYDGGEALTITGITQANPAVVSAVNTFSGGEKILIKDVEGMTQANTGILKAWTVANPTGTTFELSGIDSTGWGTYTSGGSAQVVQKDFSSGLTHLEGETLDIVTDGAVHPQKTVTAGALSLNWYANKVHVGLPAPCTLEPTKPHVQTTQGGSRGKKQRISSVLVSFYESYGCKIGRDLDNLKSFPFGTGADPALFTGEKELVFDGPWGSEPSLVLYQDQPLPLTIRAIQYQLSVNE